MFIVTLSDVLGLVIFGVIILAIVLFFGVEKTKDYIKEKSKTTQNVAKKTETKKDPKEEKTKEANGDSTKAYLIILALGILGVIIYRIYFAPEYSIIYETTNPAYEYAKDGTPVYSDIVKCKKQVSQFNSNNPPFRYKCAKNCELDATGVYVVKCDEIYE